MFMKIQKTENCNPTEKRKILVFDDMIANLEAYKK